MLYCGTWDESEDALGAWNIGRKRPRCGGSYSFSRNKMPNNGGHLECSGGSLATASPLDRLLRSRDNIPCLLASTRNENEGMFLVWITPYELLDILTLSPQKPRLSRVSATIL